MRTFARSEPWLGDWVLCYLLQQWFQPILTVDEND